MSQELQPLTSLASGSVGATVFARNQHGPYTRDRTVPTDPNTIRQQRGRTHWRLLVQRWAAGLTDAQRRGWHDYAEAIHSYSRTPRATHLSGQQAFLRNNAPRQITALGVVHDAPTVFTDPLVQPVGVNALVAVGFVSVSFDNTDTWADNPAGALFVYVSPEQTPGTNFYKGPFRRAGLVRGTVGPPPVSPRSMPDPWGITTSFNRWARTRAVTADGRVSPSVIRHFT